MTVGTIISHVSKSIELDKRNISVSIDSIVPKYRQAEINLAIDLVGTESITAIKKKLPEEFAYDDIRLVLAFRRRAETSGVK
jgi:ATP-dependent DNA helicase RecQ